MTTQAQILDGQQPFSQATARFESLVEALQDPEALKMDHGALETMVLGQGRDVLQALIQGHMDLRGLDDAGPALVGADGVVRKRRRVRGVPLRTLVGDVRVNRDIYAAPGVARLAPLDAALNMPTDLYSHGLRAQVAIEASRGSYDEVKDAVQRLGGLNVPKRQAEQLAAASAVDFNAFYEQPAEPIGGLEPDDDQLIVLTADGKGIVMRPEGLTDATRDKAARAAPKLGTRASKGEKLHRKRMALVVSTFIIAPFRRRPEDFIRSLRPVEDTAVKRPKPQNKRVWASLEKPMEAVMSDLFDAALKRDPEKKRTWVALVDGNVPQLDNLMALADSHAIKLNIIVDIIHVIEYIWKAAWCFFDEGDKAAQIWVEKQILKILRGCCSNVAASIRLKATTLRLSATERKNADKAADYLLKYKQFLRYDAYLEAGMPIATGVIEGACRYLVKDRMDITGARWGLQGAEAVLKLRAIRASGDWDAYWAFHQKQELLRNHLRNYADGKVPTMRPIASNKAKRAHLHVVI